MNSVYQFCEKNKNNQVVYSNTSGLIHSIRLIEQSKCTLLLSLEDYHFIYNQISINKFVFSLSPPIQVFNLFLKHKSKAQNSHQPL